MTNKLEYIKESLNYKGHYFLENYLGTKFLKAFVEDAIIFGVEDTKALYVEIFGEDTAPILEAMTSNGRFLLEASRIETNLLFEEMGAKKVKEHFLTEAYAKLTDISMISPKSMSAETLSNIGKKLVQSPSLPIIPGSPQDNVKNLLSLGAAPSAVAGHTGTAATALAGGKEALTAAVGGVLGFLQKVWHTIKGFGLGLISKLQTFLSANFPQAAKFLATPLNFLATNPIAQVAVPALLITGGVALAAKLLNKLRSKVGKRGLSSREVEDLKNSFEENREKILTLKKSLAGEQKEMNFA